jgi:hypothetical protein
VAEEIRSYQLYLTNDKADKMNQCSAEHLPSDPIWNQSRHAPSSRLADDPLWTQRNPRDLGGDCALGGRTTVSSTGDSTHPYNGRFSSCLQLRTCFSQSAVKKIFVPMPRSRICSSSAVPIASSYDAQSEAAAERDDADELCELHQITNAQRHEYGLANF